MLCVNLHYLVGFNFSKNLQCQLCCQGLEYNIWWIVNSIVPWTQGLKRSSDPALAALCSPRCREAAFGWRLHKARCPGAELAVRRAAPFVFVGTGPRARALAQVWGLPGFGESNNSTTHEVLHGPQEWQLGGKPPLMGRLKLCVGSLPSAPQDQRLTAQSLLFAVPDGNTQERWAKIICKRMY